MSFISWVIGGLVVLVMLALLAGFFGAFFYEQASSGAKSVLSVVDKLKGGKKY